MTRRNILSAVLALTIFITLFAPAAFAEEQEALAPQYQYDDDMSLQIAYDFLMNTMGLNYAVATGVVANLLSESGIRTTALGDAGTSYGICQWHNERWLNLKIFADYHRKPMEDIDTQLRFMQYEMEMAYPDMLAKFRSMPDTEEAAYETAYIMSIDFERPLGGECTADVRGTTATNVYGRNIKQYDCSITLMKVLYMLTIYQQNYRMPIIRIANDQILSAVAKDTFILSTFMEYDAEYWDSIDNPAYNNLPAWIQEYDLDDLPEVEFGHNPLDVEPEPETEGETEADSEPETEGEQGTAVENVTEDIPEQNAEDTPAETVENIPAADAQMFDEPVEEQTVDEFVPIEETMIQDPPPMPESEF